MEKKEEKKREYVRVGGWDLGAIMTNSESNPEFFVKTIYPGGGFRQNNFPGG